MGKWEASNCAECAEETDEFGEEGLLPCLSCSEGYECKYFRGVPEFDRPSKNPRLLLSAGGIKPILDVVDIVSSISGMDAEGLPTLDKIDVVGGFVIPFRESDFWDIASIYFSKMRMKIVQSRRRSSQK
jgi:hypothetical protein